MQPGFRIFILPECTALRARIEEQQGSQVGQNFSRKSSEAQTNGIVSVFNSFCNYFCPLDLKIIILLLD
jgi:hypothetical protein